MSWFPRPRGLTISLIWPVMLLAILLSLLSAAGCVRPKGLRNSSDATAAEQPQVPFHDSEGAGTGSPIDSSAAQDGGPGAVDSLPFHDPQNLPAGTLLTVLLKAPIAVGNSAADATFEAVVDQPVVIEGNKLIPLGAAVSGRVESSQTSDLKRNRGYVRLVLESIHLSGASLPVRTASLFVRGSSPEPKIARRATGAGAASQQNGPASKILRSDASSSGIRLEKGRRLTFRLTEPVYIAASQRSLIDR